MKRENVNPTLALVNSKIEELKAERENNLFIYATREKYLSGHGYVNELPSIEAVIECQKSILKLEKSQTTLEDSESQDALKELGLEDTIKKENRKPFILLGFPVKYWNADLKTRISELQSDKKLEELEDAKVFLTANLTEEDKNEIFNEKLSSITNLLK